MSFKLRDLIVVSILGEIVGLFGYAIIQAQEEKFPAAVTSLPLVLFAVAVPLAALVLLYVTYLLSKRVHSSLFQFGKFAAVGFSNTAIDWGVLNLLLAPLGLTTGRFAAGKAFSFAVATLNSFFWNRFWSFEKKGTERMGKEAVQFYFFTAIGLGINVGVATLAKELGPDTKFWAGIVSLIIASASSMFWDFAAYRFIVFKPAKTTPVQPQA